MQSIIFRNLLQKLSNQNINKGYESIEVFDNELLKPEYLRKENDIPAKIDYKKLRFLIADDFTELLSIHTDMLLKNDVLEVQTATNGKELIDIFEKSEIGYYHVIITDYHMPVMNGYEASKKLRMLNREDSHKVTMLLASCSDDINKKSYSGKNFDDFISKPLKQEELTDSLKKYLRL